ncbi:tetratricopeptide repeat protein [Piscinibacter sp.]|uniref:tetratricopeptide repeat protein n=1 Tax=Piscinibacter sp. TaxID=1903157 RepID=UPI002B9581AA|nr:tetratricopeptide repeat protein [Albitalea sp.]HUG23206.1 tetratricopeptide repeat protein [Albitalea sp.]
MPARFPLRVRALAIAAAAAFLAPGAFAQQAEPITRSNLDAPLFYQLLIGEIELRSGEAGTAYQVVLDAARKTRDEQLYRRATEIALQARAGEQALQATRAWLADVPQSVEAHRTLIQLLVALNRPAETVEPLGTLLKLTPEAQRSNLIMSLPRFFARTADRKQAAGFIEQALQPYADAESTRAAVAVAKGRAWLFADDKGRALQLAQAAHARDPLAEGPALLALELLPGTAQAEAVVLDHLTAKSASNGVRMVYARVLSGSQRYGDAIAQLEAVTQAEPKLAPPWLTLGALHLELRQPQKAMLAIEHYVELVHASPSAATDPHAPAVDDEEQEEEAAATPTDDRGLTQAWLMLAQAAEQQNDFKSAEAWLQKVDNPQRALEVVTRRASLLAKQGKLSEARELIRRAPEKTADDTRAKLLAEVQLLREAKRWAEANSLLASANEKYPDDIDLLYEQSMMAEKLNRLDEMERLLRRVIEIKPDHHHAHNALGYSLAERNLRLPEAKALIQKALEIAPGEPFITDSLGWVEYRMGNRQEALRLLRGAYQSRPDPEIAAHLGEVLWVSGDRDEARRIWREGHSRDAANDVLRETLSRLKVGDL